jgi:outer membrane receptor protein involved in Fe transport
MRTLLTTLGGRIAELPEHGEITLSLGGDYRYELGRNGPGSVASTGDTTDTETNHTDGRFHVFEGFGELAIVPISGHDIAQWVELDLGARGVRHGRFGSSLTYKAGGLFRTVHGIAARGTYATAFRAPSLPDIFSEAVERITTAEDPCDAGPPSSGDASRTLDPRIQAQCTAQGVPVGTRFATGQQSTLTGGNPDLQPETAATTTIGVVVEPPQLKGLAVSADYWHIDIDNAIETLGAQTILGNCYDRGVQSYCKQIERDFFTHRIARIKQFLQNVDHTTTSGIDVALRYDTKLAELGRVRAGLEAQYLLRYDLDTLLQVIHGVGYYDLGAYPRYKANLSGNWVHPRGISGSFTLRYVGSYKECAANNCNNAHNLATASRDVDRPSSSICPAATTSIPASTRPPSRLASTTCSMPCHRSSTTPPPTPTQRPTTSWAAWSTSGCPSCSSHARARRSFSRSATPYRSTPARHRLGWRVVPASAAAAMAPTAAAPAPAVTTVTTTATVTTAAITPICPQVRRPIGSEAA